MCLPLMRHGEPRFLRSQLEKVQRLPNAPTWQVPRPDRRTMPKGVRPGIDLRSTREVPRARCEFRVGIRGGPHVGRPGGGPSRAAAWFCRATHGRGHSQFLEVFEVGPVAGPPPAGLLPTLPPWAAAGLAAVAFAFSYPATTKPSASSRMFARVGRLRMGRALRGAEVCPEHVPGRLLIFMEYPIRCSVDLCPERFDDWRPECDIGCEGPTEFFGV